VFQELCPDLRGPPAECLKVRILAYGNGIA